MSGGGDTRFQKGRSGNPAGRPRKRRPHNSAFDIVFDKTLTVMQGRKTGELTIEEALELQTYQAALKGSRMAIRKVLKMIDKREAAIARKTPSRPTPVKIECHYCSGNANEALRILGIAERDPGWAGNRVKGACVGDPSSTQPSGSSKALQEGCRRHQVLHFPAREDSLAARSDCMTSEPREPAGYGRPPTASRFQKGQSGNPKGRPRNRTREIPHDAVLGQMVTIREDGRERRVTAAEAFLLQLTQKGLAGDGSAARSSLDAIDKARAARSGNHDTVSVIIRKSVRSGADAILDTLDLARLQYPTDKKRVRWNLSPWIVEAALARLGCRQLSLAEQSEVFTYTRTSHKVAWPTWWSVRS